VVNPVTLATLVIPPYPRLRASAAAHNLSPRSLRVEEITANFSERIVSKLAASDIKNT
jgi:hypothetical protein